MAATPTPTPTVQNVYLNGVDIKVEPFDLNYTGKTHKLDLLYYNNVNRYGEILTSLVYNSGIRTISDTTLIVYNPNKLFLNTDFEKSYSLIGTSNIWKNVSLLTDGLTNLRDNSANSIHTYPTFNISTDYAVEYCNGEYAYDGWYTLYSVALDTISNGKPIGTLAHNSGDPMYCSDIDTWTDLNSIDTTIDIYNFIRGGLRTEERLSYDFVSTVKINSLNKRLLDNKIEKDWFKQLNILSPKLRTLETAIELGNYDKAQHIINAVNNSLLSLLI
jgi:hypothetical protein